MKLGIVHKTTYYYGEQVTTSHHEARLTPRDSHDQRLISHDVAIEPAPDARRRRFDYFGNRVLHFSLSEPHRRLEVRTQSVVEVIAPRMPALQASPPWEQVRHDLQTDRRRDALDAYAMALESEHVAISDELRQYGTASFSAGRPLLEAVRDLASRIHADFAYDARATEVSTPLTDVLRLRRGVCQDFAHLAIGCLRARGLAARYVSGYLLTRPPPGKPRLTGADASHAWFAAFVPQQGWVDFDPTNDVLPSDEHVSVAVGRDFADVTPIRGVILGGGEHRLEVAVDVRRLE